MIIHLNATKRRQKLRLLCFPFAGGGTLNYSRWRADINENIDLCAINLPGRERLFSRPCLTDFNEYLSSLVYLIKRESGCPTIFYGHSYGGIAAYFTALELDQLDGLSPLHVFISARTPPSMEIDMNMGNMGKEQFIRVLINRYQGIPPQISHNPELLNIFLPIIQSDFKMYEKYPRLLEACKQKKIKSNITTIGYDEDEPSEASFFEWRKFTQGSHKHIQLPGGHFEVLKDWSVPVRLINQLYQLLYPQAPS